MATVGFLNMPIPPFTALNILQDAPVPAYGTGTGRLLADVAPVRHLKARQTGLCFTKYEDILLDRRPRRLHY